MIPGIGRHQTEMIFKQGNLRVGSIPDTTVLLKAGDLIHAAAAEKDTVTHAENVLLGLRFVPFVGSLAIFKGCADQLRAICK